VEKMGGMVNNRGWNIACDVPPWWKHLLVRQCCTLAGEEAEEKTIKKRKPQLVQIVMDLTFGQKKHNSGFNY
jgi:hypothetical protein